MRFRVQHIISVLVLYALTLLISISVPAQELSQLKVDSRVTKGTLANGISYHLVSDSSIKGRADFALVQKGTTDPALARHNLSSLKSFGKVKPYSFLARNGVGPDRTGYIQYEGNALIYNFHDVPTSSTSVVDSMLLMLFGIADTVPYEQDIVIAGDITAKTFQDKLNVMSMLVSKRSKAPGKDDYSWKPTESSRYIFRQADSSTSNVTITAMYASERSPKASMNTAQPIVAMKFAHELGIILRSRLAKEMYSKGIPVSSIEFKRRSSADGPDDEIYGISIVTDTLYSRDVASVLGSTLAYLDEHGAGIEEYQDAKNDLFSNASSIVGLTQGGNASWLRKCIASYLYGADLASDQTITTFFTSKDMETKKELELFNNFITALLDRQANFTLRCSSSKLADSLGVLSSFDLGWIDYRRSSSASTFRINSADTLGLEDSFPKVKLKTTEPEPLTSGEIWTFSNGMKVVFKQNTQLKGKFAYNLVVRGGYSEIPSFKLSDSTFIAGILPLYDVGGLQGYDFRRMLGANGVSMNQNVSSSGLSINGSAPSDKLMLLLKSLIAMSEDRQINTRAYDYYRKCQSLVTDASRLDDTFQQNAERYYQQMLTNLSNGYLVLVGDFNVASLKKLLTKFVGGFQVGSPSVSRPTAKEPIGSGTQTIVKELMSLPEGSVMGVEVSMTDEIQFTAERLMALRIAELALRNAVIRQTVRLGTYVETEISFKISPTEIFGMRVNCQMAAYDGLPEGIVPDDPLNVLMAIRRALIEVSTNNLSKADLESYKNLLVNSMDPQVKDPRFIASAIGTRLLDGKDILTNYQTKIKAVTADMVREILSGLNSSEKIETVIR